MESWTEAEHSCIGEDAVDCWNTTDVVVVVEWGESQDTLLKMQMRVEIPGLKRSTDLGLKNVRRKTKTYSTKRFREVASCLGPSLLPLLLAPIPKQYSLWASLLVAWSLISSRNHPQLPSVGPLCMRNLSSPIHKWTWWEHMLKADIEIRSLPLFPASWLHANHRSEPPHSHLQLLQCTVFCTFP